MHRIPKRPHQYALIETETLEYICEKLKLQRKIFLHFLWSEESLFQSFLFNVLKQK